MRTASGIVTWRYTTDHASSSYGQPVLIDDETGAAYGPGDLLTTAQAAEIIGIDPRSVRRLMRDHGLGRKMGPQFGMLTVAEMERIRAITPGKRGRPKRNVA